MGQVRQEEPDLKEGSGQLANCKPPPGQKYAEASTILLFLCTGGGEG
jgi:hypothetical protein